MRDIEDKALIVLEKLKELYPEAKCELNFGNTFQLLVATVLSAQSTDKKVNEITAELFKQYRTPEDFLSMTQAELEEKIKKIGLYRNKAKNIIQMCQELIARFGGEVPDNMEDLVSLPGVGRKTANVVLSNGFGIPAIAVDTHVFRVSNRIGLAHSNNVDDTERQLMYSIPKDKWSLAHHLLIWHGRRICEARKPKCDICPITDDCDYFNKKSNKTANVICKLK
ncbi:DNA-(apurinic or apyrimidinic site) lyase /endonuclease III [Lutispora thermophila DSM 19022]|uniref:Endonuclease III n=1 Tax=Lutispora thermophila DSM 19022 TaxID=1122184 RepID=A0A1M6CLR6_9FIRM|nr:DNA-(apurinic or apyrimidinic site) lyase /endonuclease III [Lutispora thermophila DSM 19022]